MKASHTFYCQCPNQHLVSNSETCENCAQPVFSFQGLPTREVFDADYFEALDAISQAQDQAA